MGAVDMGPSHSDDVSGPLAAGIRCRRLLDVGADLHWRNSRPTYSGHCGQFLPTHAQPGHVDVLQHFRWRECVPVEYYFRIHRPAVRSHIHADARNSFLLGWCSTAIEGNEKKK